MFIRKSGDGNYYVCRKTGTSKAKSYRNWFLIKFANYSGYLYTEKISFPQEFVGKKVRLKVEII